MSDYLTWARKYLQRTPSGAQMPIAARQVLIEILRWGEKTDGAVANLQRVNEELHTQLFRVDVAECDRDKAIRERDALKAEVERLRAVLNAAQALSGLFSHDQRRMLYVDYWAALESLDDAIEKAAMYGKEGVDDE